LNINVARTSRIDGMSLVIAEVEKEDYIYPEDFFNIIYLQHAPLHSVTLHA